MSFRNLTKPLLILVPLLFLSACGEGYEMVPYEGTPYGDRTAGKGVAYVRAKMAPQKGPVLEPAPVIVPPATDASKLLELRVAK